MPTLFEKINQGKSKKLVSKTKPEIAKKKSKK